MRKPFFVINLVIIILFVKPGIAQNWNSEQWEQFHKQAVEESLIPIRPGKTDKSPFWNINAKRFIYVPSFNFNTVNNASKYIFTAHSDVNYERFTFEAEHPWSALQPIWNEIPAGIVHVKVEGLDTNGEKMGLAGERLFYKAAPFHGPYKKKVMDYTESVKLNLESMFSLNHYQKWLTEKEPDINYYLYCYPSKIIGSIVEGMAKYSQLTDKNKADALAIAKNSADYLLSVSQPKGSPLEYFPPTYSDHETGTSVAKKKVDVVMMFYPAITGSAYLDLYEASGDIKYQEAAINIGKTYNKLQLISGTWPLVANLYSGKSLSNNLCVPTDIIFFLDRLIRTYKKSEFSEVRKKAFNWIMENPMKTYYWEGQFEDVELSQNYSNMERGKPLAFARLLLGKSDEYSEYIPMAEELIRFAEDQFIIWENPLPRELFRTKKRPIPPDFYNPETWATPCALEQYSYYTPIDASVASAMEAFTKAYEVTGKDLYLAKAVSLADAMTYAQQYGGGIYPTYLRNFKNTNLKPEDWSGWINCAVMTSNALMNLDKVKFKSK